MRELIDAFFRERSIVNHHIASFNDFLPTIDNPNSRMQRIVDNLRSSPEDERRGIIKLDEDRTEGDVIEIRIGRKRDDRGRIDLEAKPTITLGLPVVKEANGATHPLNPMESRLRNLNYTAPIYLDFTVVENGIEREPERVHIGNFPVMVKSKRCLLYKENMETEGELGLDEYRQQLVREFHEDPFDPGGYFIIGGTERALISLEDLAPNRVLVEFNERYGRKVEVAKVFSQKEGYRALTLMEKKKDGQLIVSVPTASGQIPLIILMKALGMEKDEDIYNAVVSTPEMANIVYANIEECQNKKIYPPNGIFTRDDAISYLEKKFATGQAKEYRIKKVESILDRSLLPHLGDTREDRIKKAIFLGRVARTVLELSLGMRREDDKDHYANKRLKLAGDLMEDLFRVAFANLVKDLKYQLERSYARRRELKISSAIRPDLLTQRLLHALATGNWVGGRAGVSQLLDRTSNMSALSHLRRVTSPTPAARREARPHRVLAKARRRAEDGPPPVLRPRPQWDRRVDRRGRGGRHVHRDLSVRRPEPVQGVQASPEPERRHLGEHGEPRRGSGTPVRALSQDVQGQGLDHEGALPHRSRPDGHPRGRLGRGPVSRAQLVPARHDGRRDGEAVPRPRIEQLPTAAGHAKPPAPLPGPTAGADGL